ncbi:MAG: hypothetical protein WCK09_11770 [Bacteroidota bacterium]
MEWIQKYYLILSLDTLPKFFKLACPVNVVPGNRIHITILKNEEQHEIIFDSHSYCNNESENTKLIAGRLDKLYALITKTIYNRKCISTLQSTDIIVE